MFETRIQNTKLAGSLADCMFRHINGCDYEGDYSFISTLRALLMNRITGDDRITFKCRRFSVSVNMDDMTSNLARCIEQNVIAYVSVSRDAEQDEDESKQAFFGFTAPESLHEFMDVRGFFEQKMSCRAFINEQTRSAIIIVLDSNIRKHHLAQCIIPKLIPWYFEQGRISVNERAILYGLRERRPDAYQTAIENICNTDTFKQKSTAAAIMSFKRKGLERQKLQTERNIQNYNNHVDKLHNELLSQLRNLNQENFKLNGILLALESDDSSSDEVTQFISSNRNIRFIDSDGGDVMKFIITGHLDIYDPEAYRSMARNNYSWYWSESATSNGPFMTRENRKRVMDAIFGDSPVFKIKTYGVYYLNLDSGNVSADGGRYEHIDESETHYANPHLYYASCLGSYRQHIAAAIQRGDLIGAISQCITSVHSVNVTESATFRHLCCDIFKTDKAILEGPNGQSFTTRQAFEYLTQQMNTSGKSEGE